MTPQERLALNIGNMMLQNLSLSDQVENLTKIVKDLEAELVPHRVVDKKSKDIKNG